MSEKSEDNKGLMLVSGAVHTDLYDGGGKNAIPFEKMKEFLIRCEDSRL